MYKKWFEKKLKPITIFLFINYDKIQQHDESLNIV